MWYRLSGGVVPLLHCNICPASYHVSCLPPTKRASSSALHSSAWTCPSCKSGRKPLYGDIVWVKYSNYRSVENLPAAVAKWVSAYVTWTISLQIDSWSDFGIFKCQLTRVLVVRLSFLRVKWLKRTHTIFGDRAFSAAGPRLRKICLRTLWKTCFQPFNTADIIEVHETAPQNSYW